MKKIISALAILISTALLFAAVIPAAAAGSVPTQKEEVVYGILGLDGIADSLYVVNIFNTGDVTDYGNYTDVQNLTNADKIVQSGDEISVASTADRFYYQGTLPTKALPWDIHITYMLDGNEIESSALPGVSGELEIHIAVLQNPNVDSTFYDNYALQIALTLSTELCGNILANGATLADAGADKQLSYIVLPGKGADITVSADVHDFEMNAITFNGIKLTIDLDIDKSAFSEQLTELTDAIAQLDDGAGDLSEGADQLNSGMTQYLVGLDAYKNGIEELSGGASQLSSGASALESGLESLCANNDALVVGAISMRQSAFDMANAQLSGMGIPTLTPENYNNVLSAVPDLAAVKTQLDDAVQFAQGIISYTAGVTDLASGASQMSEGASTLSLSLSQVASGTQDLYDGAAQFNAAIGSLKEGLAEYKDGTAELRVNTGDIDAVVSDQIDELLSTISGGDEVKSFVSDKNTDVTSVQFVIKTGAVEIREGDNTAAVEEKLPTFWDRFLALFKID